MSDEPKVPAVVETAEAEPPEPVHHDDLPLETDEESGTRENERLTYTAAAERKKIFIAAFVKEPKGQKAALAAGYSKACAANMATIFLRDPAIRAEIARRRAHLARKYEVSTERIVQELARIGFANISNFTRLTESGDRVIDLSEATYDDLASIQELTVEDFLDGRGDDAREVRRTKLKLHNKTEPLLALGKQLGLFGGNRAGDGSNVPPTFEFTMKLGHVVDGDSKATAEVRFQATVGVSEAVSGDLRPEGQPGEPGPLLTDGSEHEDR